MKGQLISQLRACPKIKFALSHILVLAAIGVYQIQAKGQIVGCSAEIDANIWNLNALRRSPEQGDYQVSYQAGDGTQTTLNFNLCSNTYRKCVLADKIEEDDFGNMQFTDGKCHRLSQDDMDEGKAKLIDEDKPEVGLRLKFESEEQCTKDQNYGFTIDIRCDEEAVNPIPRIKTDSVSKNNCQPLVYLDSKAGCISRSFNKMWKFFEDLVEEFGVLLIIMGLFLTFFGSQYNQVTLFITGFVSGSLGTLFIMYFIILPEFTPNWGHVFAFFLAGLAGIFAGSIAAMWVKLGVFILGGWLGGTMGMMVYNSVFASVFADSGPKAQYGFWFIILLFVVMGALLLTYLFTHALAVGSSAVGAYCLVRGVGIFAGGFPNEYLVYQEISNGSYAEMPDEFYIYLACYVVIALIGLIVQERAYIKTKYQERKEKKNKKKNKKSKKGGDGPEEQEDHEEVKQEDDEETESLLKKKKKNKNQN